MKNEQKASEIAKSFVSKRTENFASKILTFQIESACKQMAQWKDEQFSKFLLWLDDNYVIRRFTDGESMTYAELIDNFKSNSYERNTQKTD